MEEGLQPEDLGFHDHDVHDASKGVIEYRLKQVRPTVPGRRKGVQGTTGAAAARRSSRLPSHDSLPPRSSSPPLMPTTME